MVVTRSDWTGGNHGHFLRDSEWVCVASKKAMVAGRNDVYVPVYVYVYVDVYFFVDVDAYVYVCVCLCV